MLFRSVLYSGNAESTLRVLITQSIINIQKEFPTDGVRRALRPFQPPSEANLSLLRAIYFTLLNYDSISRKILCETKVIVHIPALCPFKACRFYDLLKDEVLYQWIKNENIGTVELVENLKESYLVA